MGQAHRHYEKHGKIPRHFSRIKVEIHPSKCSTKESYRLKKEGTVSVTAYIIHWRAWGKNKEINKTCNTLFPKYAGIVFSRPIQSPKDLAFLFITGKSFASPYGTNFLLLAPFATTN